jgi:cobalt-zinc-cadmium efflux system membrane fusion protein
VVNINLGKLVGPSDLLFEILDNQHLHLEIEVFAKDLPLLRAGQRVEAFLPGTEGVFPAQVHLIGKTIDPGTKTARAHAHFSDEPIPLPVGAYLRARVLVRESEALTLPQSAMVREGDDFFVFVKQGEHFEKTTVRAGRAEGDYIEILALELGPGEQVALKGAYYLQGMLSGGEGHSH